MRTISKSCFAAAVLAVGFMAAACAERNGSRASGAASPVSAPSDPAAPEVRGGSLRDVLALGAQTNRNVLVEYWSETCPYCGQMDRGALSDPAVKAGLGDVVYVRMTKGKDGESFESRFGSQPTPTYIVMKPDGGVLGRQVSGVVAPKDFATFVAWAKSGAGDMPNVSGKGG